MSEGISLEPDRLYIDKNDRYIYTKKLKNEEMFKAKENLDLFLFAMLLGYKNNSRVPIANKDGWTRTEYIKPEARALIDSVALSTSDSPDILSNRVEVFKIAEEFAHGGLKILIDKINNTQHGTFWKQYEKELFEMYSDLDLKV